MCLNIITLSPFGQWIRRSCLPQEKWPVLSWGGRRQFSPWKYLYFFCPPQKYMKNSCCYYFSSQHDAFSFFLTFLTLENNWKPTDKKKRLIFKQFLYWIFLGGRRQFDHFPWMAGSHGFTVLVQPGDEKIFKTLEAFIFWNFLICLFPTNVRNFREKRPPFLQKNGKRGK